MTKGTWNVRPFDGLMHDVRYGLRLLLRSPSFAALALVPLALGMAATTAVFNVADAVLFRPLAVSAPEELHEVRADVHLAGSIKRLAVSADAVRTMSGASDVGGLAGFRTIEDALLDDGAAHRSAVRVELVSERYFDVLGVTASAGGLLNGADGAAAPVPVVVSEAFWRGRFAADMKISGRSATLNGTPIVIVGVAKGFRGVVAERPADVLAPVASARLIDPATAEDGLRVIVRLPTGIAPAVAEQRIAILYKEAAIGPNSMLRRGEVRVALASASGGASDAREKLERPVVVGLALVGLLLLVACANTGGLLLARLTSRSGEFGLRLAIGAGHFRLMRQLIVEGLLLTTVAAAAGLLIAQAAAPLLLRSIPLGPIPPDFELRFDWRLALFASALVVAAGLMTAGAPLLRLLHSGASSTLSENARTIVRGRRRLTQILVALQVACSLLLLVTAAAMTRTLINLGRVDPGFEATGVVSITIDAAGRTPDRPALPSYFAALQERIASAPGVGRVSFVQTGLMTEAATTGAIEITGWTPGSDADRWARMFFVGPGFFEALGMRLVAGSSIGHQQAAGRERVAVVNRSFAEFYFGSVTDALDRTVNGNVRIVGVVADASYGTLRDEPVRAMFVPYTQAPPRRQMIFVVRTAGDAFTAARAAVEAIRAHDSALRPRVARLDDQVAATFSRERFVAVLASVLSGLALLLSCGGLSASVAYAASERQNELAVRIALGATGSNIVRLLVSDPLRVALFGLILGVPGAYVVMRAVSALLFGVEPFDLTIVVTVGVALLGVAAGAAAWPAWRAVRIDPLVSLKRP
jgi:putative ABC transport system permease protein